MTNLLELALPIINNIIDSSTGSFSCRAMQGQVVNEIGVPSPSYGAWLACQGTVQPVNRSRYEALGLDFSKNHINVWGSLVVKPVDIDYHPDQILWGGKIWNVLGVTAWNPHNGWMNLTAVEYTNGAQEDGTAYTPSSSSSSASDGEYCDCDSDCEYGCN